MISKYQISNISRAFLRLKTNVKYQIFIVALGLLLLIFQSSTTYHPQAAYAQYLKTCAPVGGTTPPKAEGLVTTPLIIGSKFGTLSGACIIDPRTAFAPYKRPSYESLKSLYYTQSKAQKVTITDYLPSTIADSTVYFSPITLRFLSPSSVPTGGGTALVFIDGDLVIGGPSYLGGPITLYEFIYGTADSGLVFVVSGEVYIHKDITRFDGVIISSGTICTSTVYSTWNFSYSCPYTNVVAPQLVVNGSLISLNETKPIKFRRTLDQGAIKSNFNSPAELINHQVKYLVILRDLLSDTYQKWSEIQ